MEAKRPKTAAYLHEELTDGANGPERPEIPLGPAMGQSMFAERCKAKDHRRLRVCKRIRGNHVAAKQQETKEYTKADYKLRPNLSPL